MTRSSTKKTAPAQAVPSSSIATLLATAKTCIAAGEKSLCQAAESIAKAAELGASQREIAETVGKSAAWVNGLLAWRKGGYAETPFGPQSKAKRELAAVQAPKHRTPDVTPAEPESDDDEPEPDTEAEAEARCARQQGFLRAMGCRTPAGEAARLVTAKIEQTVETLSDLRIHLDNVEEHWPAIIDKVGATHFRQIVAELQAIRDRHCPAPVETVTESSTELAAEVAA
jgi:hypothetical protein